VRITVDREACTGHGRCYTVAPEVYGADDDGYCVIPNESVLPAFERQALLGARNCPEDAITVHD
jgi:ferredoxin